MEEDVCIKDHSLHEGGAQARGGAHALGGAQAQDSAQAQGGSAEEGGVGICKDVEEATGMEVDAGVEERSLPEDSAQAQGAAQTQAQGGSVEKGGEGTGENVLEEGMGMELDAGVEERRLSTEGSARAQGCAQGQGATQVHSGSSDEGGMYQEGAGDESNARSGYGGGTHILNPGAHGTLAEWEQHNLNYECDADEAHLAMLTTDADNLISATEVPQAIAYGEYRPADGVFAVTVVLEQWRTWTLAA